MAEVLRDIPEDHVFEDDEGDDAAVWDHEARFARDPTGWPSAPYKSHLRHQPVTWPFDIYSTLSTSQ